MFSTEIILGVLLAALVIYTLVNFFFRLDGAIDERQETYSKLASLFDRAHFPKMASIGHSLAAWSIKKAVVKIRALVDALDTEEDLLAALQPNFVWQTGMRIKRPQDRAELLETVVNDPTARKEVIVLLAELAAEAAKTAIIPVTTPAPVVPEPVVIADAVTAMG